MIRTFNNEQKSLIVKRVDLFLHRYSLADNVVILSKIVTAPTLEVC